MAIWTVCLHAVLLSSLTQPPGTPPGSPPGSAASGTPSTPTATGAPSQGEVPLGLHAFAVALLGAITTVLVYPTRRSQS
jgi:hypothetical protein